MSKRKSGSSEGRHPPSKARVKQDVVHTHIPAMAAPPERSAKRQNNGSGNSAAHVGAAALVSTKSPTVVDVAVAQDVEVSTSQLDTLPAGTGMDFATATWTQPSPSSDLRKKVDQIIIERYSPSGLVIDGNFQILYFQGDTSAYLRPMPGNASLDLFKMVRRQLIMPIRSALLAARQQGATVYRKGAPYVRNGQICRTDVEVVPIYGRSTTDADYLVLFQNQPLAVAMKRRRVQKSSEAPNAAIIDELKHDLAATRRYLRAILTEHDAATEDLWTAHQELLSSNQDLQSSNEELQSVQEEAQCANEELRTLNDELQTVTSDLSQTADDWSSTLDALDLPVVIVGNDRRIRRFTPSAQKLFNVTSADVGYYLGPIQPAVEIPHLEELIDQVITNVCPVDREVHDDAGHWYALRIRPHRTEENKIEAVVALVDIDEVKGPAEAVFEAMRAPFLVLDSQFRVVMANPAFYDKFHRKREEIENRVLFELGPGEWNPHLRELLQKVVREKHEVTDCEVQYDTQHFGHMIMSVSARQLREADGESPRILLVIRDVTERRDREDKIQQLLARLMTAREDEGKRIARELHDSFGPRLARVNLLVSDVQGQLASQPGLAKELERIKTEVSEVAKASHDLSYGLHPSALVHLGIEAALESECVNFSKASGITVTFSAKNVPDSLSDTVALCLYRIAQEALQNIRKHAQAKTVAATLTGIGPDLVMIIRDSGAGFDAQAARAGGGLGLASMEERIRMVNGKVTVNSKLGEGTKVEVRIPIETPRPAIRVRID